MPGEGIEPPTFGLQNRCTTAVLTRQIQIFPRHIRHLTNSGTTANRLLCAKICVVPYFEAATASCLAPAFGSSRFRLAASASAGVRKSRYISVVLTEGVPQMLLQSVYVATILEVRHRIGGWRMSWKRNRGIPGRIFVPLFVLRAGRGSR